MDFIDYREKLGIGFCDKEKAQYFFTKAFNLFDGMNHDYMYNQIDETEYFNFCDTTGTQMEHGGIYNGGYDLIIKTLHRHTSSIEDFLAYYMAFVNCQKDKPNKNWTKGKFKKVICGMLDESHIPYEVLKDQDGYFIFPKGAKELDSALVSQPLEWLSKYPNAHKTFCIALKQYSEGIYIRDVADNLRKSFEEFLREFFENDNDLNKNKKEVEKFLKEQNADPRIITMLVSLISHYYLLNNEVAKHNDKMDKKYLEFLLYQTGLFIRMLIVVKMEETNNAD